MKKLSAMLLIFCLIFGLFACAAEPKKIQQTNASENNNVTSETKTETELLTEAITKKIIETVTREDTTQQVIIPGQSKVNVNSVPAYLSFTSGDITLNLLKANLNTPNALISPVSVMTALTMAGIGAKGDTKSEIEKVIGGTVEMKLEALSRYIGEVNSDKNCGVKIANSVWLNNEKNRLSINDSFVETCQSKLYADIFKEEFKNSTANQINGWIKDKTDGTIKKVIDEIPDDAVAYLINTVLFDAEWTNPYYDTDVRENQIFTTADGRKQKVTMLYSSEAVNDTLNFRLGKNEAVCRYYKNGYRFVALLPDEGVSIADALNSFSGKDLTNAVTKTNTDENGEFLYGMHLLNLQLPKFKFECKFRLSDTLKALGMTTSFDPKRADFSDMAISSRGNIFINEIYHNTYISLTEKGTKAGAATVIVAADGICATPEEVKTLIFNRPFIYFIVAPDGTALFAGTVTDFGN